MHRNSSVLFEFGWLAYFLVVFALLVYAFNIFIVPHHFNDRIADVLAGILAGIALIVTRSRFARRG
ncbi:MAG: hypothetical protein M3R51_01590 [Candidatus Eremiobacteraeota bacterium]|nr:hypothetical protein [Candidatus Eremiobacteraeota bacterium]